MDSSSSSSSSSSSAACNWLYDVFPSFSGDDVRRTLLSHLLLALNRRFISSFRDNEIEKSHPIRSELVDGIRDSRIAIVVFSVKYASSTWCLDELLEIVKCKKERGQMVIPIFYDLDPSHVRKQNGEFGEAFLKTCEDKSDDIQIRWKKALTDVANIHGYHSKNWDTEATLIEDITNDVSRKINLTSSMKFAGFVGIEDHIAEMSSLLSLESKEVRMVGIWGPTGIGKTTIARALFSKLSRHFHGSVYIDRGFISKTMESYRRANPDDFNMKLHLQRKFLSEILNKKEINIHHLDVMEERLKHHKLLIILDDLDDQVVLDALAGGIQWFGCGSRVIVITKDKHVLRAHGIDNNIYVMGLPSDKQALEMFCRYAFRQNSPYDGFSELASEVAKLAGNLPLGLNVLGMYLRGRDKEDWLDMLPRLRKRPERKILKALRGSYDELSNKEDKEIFRHISCIFNGMETNDIKLLLADSGLDVKIGLKNLEDKSLIHERWNTIHVHCLVEEMGKEIVRAQSNKPKEREFLVGLKDIYDVVNSNSVIRKVVGILLNLAELEELIIDKEAFKRFRNLRFIRIYEDSLALHKQVRLHLPGGLDYLPPKLKLLCWDQYPMRYLPSSFRGEHLIVLRMRNSNLEKLWEEAEFPTCFEDMVEDIMEMEEAPSSLSRNLKDTSDLTNLEKSDLNSLVEIPSSVGKIQYLNKLYMGDCKDLEAISTKINLKSLYRLDLNGCLQFQSFPNISNNISYLCLNQTAIREVPSWIENFSKLICLEMQECKRLEYISPNISKLRFLEKADFSNCRALTDASWFDDSSTEANEIQTKLPVLSFINCFKLDQESLIQQAVSKYLILPGGQVPLYFTNRATGSSVAVNLLQSSLTQHFVGFKACLVIDADEPKQKWNGSATSSLMICCNLTGKERNLFDSTDYHIAIDVPCQMKNHLVIFDFRFTLKKDNDSVSELNYDGVMNLEFNFTIDSLCKIKSCGLRLFEVCTSLDNKSNSVSDSGHCKEYGENNVDTKRSRKRIQISGKNTQETTDLLCN